MKATFTIVFLSLLSFHLFAWHAYGPEGVKASDICFDEQSGLVEVICSSKGMYVWTAATDTWQFYSVDSLPVHKGIIIESQEILLISFCNNQMGLIIQGIKKYPRYSVLRRCFS